jgi:shikimate dehydrogenase
VLRAAVLGSPVAHSLSPVLHETGYAVCGLADWRYDRVELGEEELAGFVAGLGPEWRGLSLTMPLKEAALAVADEVDDLARRAGAANTLVRRPGGSWAATNTDVEGVAGALRPALRPGGVAAGGAGAGGAAGAGPAGGAAAVLGSGATARSTLLALDALAAEGLLRHDVVLHARSRTAAEGLLDWAEVAGLGLGLAVAPLAPGVVDPDATVVVSTLPPAAAEAAVAALPPRSAGVLLDVVYAGWPTPLAAAAASRGMAVVSGLDMLVHQAAAQFVLFTGVPAPVDAMLAAGRAALAR